MDYVLNVGVIPNAPQRFSAWRGWGLRNTIAQF